MKKLMKVLLIFALAIMVFIPLKRVKADVTYSISVERPNGDIESYSVSPVTTILELKQMIYAQENLPVDRQKLIFAGDIMDDNKTIADYNVPANADISLIPIWQLTFNNQITGSADDISTVLVDDSSIYNPQNPTREGYTFAGWYEQDATLRFAFNSTTITEDNTFYARWFKNVSEVDLTLEAPIVGERVTVNSEYEPDKTPAVTSNTPDVNISFSAWIDIDQYELFEGTFEEDEYYYAYIDFEISNQESDVFIEEVLNNIKVNGKEPEEIFPLYDYFNGTVIAKIKSVKNEPETAVSADDGQVEESTKDTSNTDETYNESEQNQTSIETNSPKAGDNITFYIAVMGLCIVGASIIYSKKD